MNPQTSALDTSASAYQALTNREKVSVTQRIFDIVHKAQRLGAKDMSRKEIQRAYELDYGRIDEARVAARVNNLLAAKRLMQRDETRICNETGNDIHPVYVPLTQVRWVA